MRLNDQLHSVVAAAAASGEVLEVGPHAKRLASAFNEVPRRAIADQLIMAAAQAGVPVEIDQTAG